MSSVAAGVVLMAIVIAFVGAIALLVGGLEKALGERIRSAWDEIDRRSADVSSAADSRGDVPATSRD